MEKIQFSIIILISMLFFDGCKSKLIKYEIADNYIGPAIIFIYPEKEKIENNSGLKIISGIGFTTEKNMRNKFVFQSIQSKEELNIINIGDENSIKDGKKYIFNLSHDKRNSVCGAKELNMISFFVGKKTDFEIWEKKYSDVLDYFDSSGIDWCNFYGSASKW